MKTKLFAVLLLSFCTLPIMAAEKASNFGEMFTKGVYDVKLRLAFEYSDVENGNVNPAKGLTLSSYVGFRTAEYEGFSLYAQVHNLWKMDDRYDDEPRPGQGGKYDGDYDVIADPDGTRIQQLYADFTMLPDTKVRIGRQEIILDDSRFIGNIGWRNTAQAFDAITLTNTSIPDTKIFLGYIDKIATILLEEAEYDGIWLANVNYSGIKGHSQTAFAYLVDSESKASKSSKDSATYGFRLNGAFDKVKYDMTYAHQTDYQDSENRNLDFFQGYLGYDFGGIEPGIGYSYIDGSDEADEQAFDTLFSTAHKFNGWADSFLSTNGGGLKNGLQDIYASLKFKAFDINFGVIYHYFDTTETHTYSNSYGQEIDFVASKQLAKNLTATAKLAYFDATSDSSNPTKDELVFWLRLDYSFSAPIADPFNIN